MLFGLHQSCHGQRGLMLSQMSEISGPGIFENRKFIEYGRRPEITVTSIVKMSVVVLAALFA
jgi:hypothetical protein